MKGMGVVKKKIKSTIRCLFLENRIETFNKKTFRENKKKLLILMLLFLNFECMYD